MKRSVKMKAIALVLAAAVTALTACGGQSASGEAGTSAAASNRLEEILQRGYMEVATEPYFAPQEFIDSSKEGDEQDEVAQWIDGLDLNL